MRPEPKLQLWLGVSFSVLAMGLLLLFFLKPGLFHPSTEHRTSFADVTGLRVGAEVIYAGYVVGRVGRIDPRFDEGIFDVALRLRRDWIRPENVVAEIDESNPFRPASVVLSANPECAAIGPAAPDTIPGCGRRANVIDMAGTVAAEAIRVIDLAKGLVAELGGGKEPSLEGGREIMTRAQSIVENLEAVTRALRVLASPERIDAVGAAVDDLAIASSSLKSLTSQDRVAAVGRAVDQLSEAIGALRVLVSEERVATLGAAVDDLADASASARRIMSQATVVMEKANQVDPALLNRAVAEVERTTRTVGELIEKNEETITTTLSETKFMLQTTAVSLQQVLLNLEEASRTLNDLMGRLRDDPSVLLHGRSFRTPGTAGAPN